MISDLAISDALRKQGFEQCIDEGRLMLLELIIKAQSGCYNSHTEELFLTDMKVLKKDRAPNIIGRKFLLDMLYRSSHRKPIAYELMRKFRV